MLIDQLSVSIWNPFAYTHKEISLRKICGSSLGHIYLMLTVEFLIILISSGLLGMMFIELALPEFRMLSQVNGDIYGKAAFYFIIINVLALCMMSPVILHNKKNDKGQSAFFPEISSRIPILYRYAFYLLHDCAYEAN